MTMTGIDVQRWQGIIDFNKVKTDNRVQFAIIKAGGSDAGIYKDPMFEINYRGFKAIGVPVGAYYFVGPGFISANDGLADAKRFAQLLDGKQFEMPVYVDVEANFQAGKQAVTDAVIAFCDYMESRGFYVGIYGSDISTFKEKVDLTRLNKYTLWVARYGSKPSYVKSYAMWQFTSTYSSGEARIPGITSNGLDRNYCYVDFPSIIKSVGLNGFKKSDNGGGDESNPAKLHDVTLKQMTQGDVNKAVNLAKQLGVEYSVT